MTRAMKGEKSGTKFSVPDEVDVLEARETERREAREDLVERGVFVAAAGKNFYHGRAFDTDGAREDYLWDVDPDFDNGGHFAGRVNTNKRPALNLTEEPEVVRHYAELRSEQGDGDGQAVHEVVFTDPDAPFVNIHAAERTPEQIAKIRADMEKLRVPLLEAEPVDFAERDDARKIMTALSLDELQDEDNAWIAERAKTLDVRENTLKKIVGAANVQKLLELFPEQLLEEFLLSGEDLTELRKVPGAPVNFEYVKGWMRANHVVGTRVGAIGRNTNKYFELYHAFDLEHTREYEHRVMDEEYRDRISGELGRTAIFAHSDAEDNLERDGTIEVRNFMKILSNDTLSSPKILVGAAKNIDPSFRELFDGDAGVWEGFSVGQHTETALRVFRDNFEGDISEDLRSMMRLAILTHDIGKAEAVKNRDAQDSHNRARAWGFMDRLELGDVAQMLVTFITGRAQKLTTAALVGHDPAAREKLLAACRAELKDWAFYGDYPDEDDDEYEGENDEDYEVDSSRRDESDSDDPRALAQMCEILQTCDSAAYTPRAVTRDGDLYYRNGNSRFLAGAAGGGGFLGWRVRYDGLGLR